MTQPQVNRELRSPREIRKMRRAGLVVWQSHQAAFRRLKPGVTTFELNEVYRETFRRFGASPLFLGYGPEDAPFPAETCISINEELVHGIPGPREIKSGDIVSLDTGCRLDHWCGDAAVTHAIGEISDAATKLLSVTRQTLDLAFELLGSKPLWSEIAKEMETFVEDHGLSVVRQMTGHGIGRELHEPPQAPNYWSDEIGAEHDFDIRPGVVFACEPMVNTGTEDLDILSDDWTAVTADRKLSAHFEHTIAITKDGPIRLTAAPNDNELEFVDEDFRDAAEWVHW